MSREKPKNVAEAVTHLRRSLKLSKEKFAARVGCSFQTVMRWESGRAKIAEGNLVRLWELAQDHAPLAEEIFANETRGYRRLLEANGVADRTSRDEANHALRQHLEKLGQALDTLQKRQFKPAEEQLRAARDDFEALLRKQLEDQPSHQD